MRLRALFASLWLVMAMGTTTATHAASQQLTWSATGQVGTFDLYLSTSNPPRLAKTGLTGTSYTADNLANGTTYFWYVLAHASCDPARTSQSSIKSFATTGACTGAGAFNLNSPANQEGAVAVGPTLNWTASANAVSYDVYLGTSQNPPLYKADVPTNSLQVPKLTPLTTYQWKVIARAACDVSRNTTSAIQSFTVGQTCGAPSVPEIRFAPAMVSSGQTYAVSWSDSTNFDSAGSYIVERASDSGFSNITDSQQTAATSASFVAGTASSYFHRVRSVSGCPGKTASANSAAKSVTVNAATPSVIFTIQPKPVITKLGDKLEDQRGSFTMENIGSDSVQVIVGHQEINGSVPFFQIIDPFGGAGDFVSLDPHKPKNMELRYSGPANDQAASYEGLIYLVSSGTQFAVNPLVYVNLKVGGDANAAAPKFLVDGIESEYTFFTPADGDDTSRPSINVDILNSGSTPMEVGGEVGPEMWLKVDRDWNKAAIPPSGFKTVRLFTQRNRAPNGSALPRYTYFTIRNKGGQSARLLVEDNGGALLSKGRLAPPETGERSYVIPFVTTASAATSRTFSRLRITNVGSDPVQLDLIFTPADADGFDGNLVQRVTIVAPPNDVVNLTDPLRQIFGITTSASGSMEVHAAQEKVGFLTVTASVFKQVAGGGGYGYSVPVVSRGAGARSSGAQVIAGARAASDAKTTLLLTETTGREKTSVRVTLVDAQGAARGNQLVEVPRYGLKQIPDVISALGGGSALEGGRIELSAEQGGGAVVGLAIVSDPLSENGAALISRDADISSAPSTLGRPGAESKSLSLTATGAMTYYIPGTVNAEVPLAGEPTATSKTRMTFTAASDATTTFNATYTDVRNSKTYTANVSVGARQSVDYANVVEDLFKVPAGTRTDGIVKVDTTTKGQVFARVTAKTSKGTIGDALPILTVFDEALSGGGSTKPLYADGIEQSTDAGKGTRSTLTLSELGGRPATVNVRLYEAGNRSLPIAEKDVSLTAGQSTTLDTLFSVLGLDSEDRRKDRTNVEVIASVKSGSGLVAGLLTTTDNRTGEIRKIALLPTGGVAGAGTVGSTPDSGPPVIRVLPKLPVKKPVRIPG